MCNSFHFRHCIIIIILHFQNLSNSSRPQNIPGTSGVQGPLDYEISLEELETSSNIMKYGKASSYDGSCNEMILALVKTYPQILLKLFNGILQSNEVVPDWAVCMIVPHRTQRDNPYILSEQIFSINSK